MIKNNQGVTLVELIVVILIMGILAGTAMIGMKSIDAGNAQSTVNRVSALLDYVQVENMSKDKTYYLVIEKSGSSYIAKVQYDQSGTRKDVLTEKLKLKDGAVTYYTNAGAAETAYTVDDIAVPSVTLEISYNKGSGDFHIGSSGEIKRIVISAAGRTHTIYLVTATGKHYIE